MKKFLDWVMGCRPSQIHRRMVSAGWVGSCCRCERDLPGHYDECRYQPDRLCTRCIDEMLSGPSKGTTPSSVWRPLR